MNMFQRIRGMVVLLVLAVAGAVGCHMPKASDLKPSKLFSLDSAWPWGDDEELEIEIPVRMVGMWTDTVLHTQNAKSQRGFGGRLIFYGQDANKPVAVDGELVVYAFDETGREPTDNKPTRRYVFPPDQVALHQSKSPLGPSYSFWLPWDEAGGPQTKISLICRFQPKGGALVTSEQTSHSLPGALRPEAVLAAKGGPQLPEGVPSRPARPELPSHSMGLAATDGAQLASYVAPGMNSVPNAFPGPTSEAVEPERRMTTTTIALPQNYKLPSGSAPPRSITHRSSGRPAVVPAQTAPLSTQMPQSAIPAQEPVPAAPAGQMQMPTPLSATGYQPQQPPSLPATYNPMYAPMNAGHMVNQGLQRAPLTRLTQLSTFHPQQPLQQAVPMQAAGSAVVSYR